MNKIENCLLHICSRNNLTFIQLFFIINKLVYFAGTYAIKRKMSYCFKSFMESAQEARKRPQLETDKSFIRILGEFPLKNLEDLHAMERKLKQDITFESELVR